MGSFAAEWWSHTHARFNHFELTCVGTFAVTMSLYWGVGLAFLALDLTRRPGFLYRYKLQQDGVDRTLLPRLFRTLLAGQLFVLLPFAYGVHWLSARGIGIVVNEQLPPAGEVVLQLIAFVLWEEVAFYYSHRALHHPALYARFHKVHHEFKAPIALAASYAHPVELVLNNVLPLVFGPVVCGSHILTTYLWFAIAVVGSQLHHCGYRLPGAHLPFDPQPMFHDFHHSNFNGNYGLLTVLDWLHGTDAQWRAAHRTPPACDQGHTGTGSDKKKV